MPTEMFSYVKEFYQKYNINIPADRDFIPGTDCPGKEPFGKSQACYQNCFGTKGLVSLNSIKDAVLPCKAIAEPTIEPITLFEQNLRRGIAGI